MTEPADPPGRRRTVPPGTVLAIASFGGFLAFLDAAGVDAVVYEEWVKRNPVNDYRLPRTSLIRGHKAREMFVRTFGMDDIERLRRSMFLRHRRPRLGGPARAPLRARRVRDRLQHAAAGVTLRHHENARGERAAPTSGDGALQPWDEDRTVILPGLGEQLVRIVTLSSTNGKALAEKHAAVIIRPNDAGVGMLEFHMIDKMRSEGRRAARAALAAASNGTGA